MRRAFTRRTAVFIASLAVIAVGGTVAAVALLDRRAQFDNPTLTQTQAQQAAAGLATALDDLGARFLVGDPATERLQVLHWDDDVASAEGRIAERLGFIGTASAFVHASATELERRGAQSHGDAAVTVVETRVTEATTIGLGADAADWVRVDIVQEETYAGGETSSSAVSYAVAVRAGAIVDVRALDGLLGRSDSSSAEPVTSRFVAAVLAGDESVVERHTAGAGVADRDLATLRAWLVAAGDIEVVELASSRMGSLQVAYVVPQRGPLLRFEVILGGTPQVTWEIVAD